MFIKRGANGFHDSWKWVLGAVVIFLGCQLMGALPFTIAVFYQQISENGMDTLALLDESTLMTTFSKNITFFLLMFTFVIGTLTWWIWIKYIHKLSWTEATTSRPAFDWNRAFFAFGVVGFVSVVTTLLGYYLEPEIYIWNFDATNFAFLAVIAIVLVPIQTTWEELFFRSYAMQGLGIIAGNRAVPYLITSIVFGMMHIFNPEIAKMGYIVMIWYIGTGFLLGTFTLMDEGTELAIGFHAANNLFIALLVTADWTAFQTDSLLIDTSDPTANWTTFIPMFIYYPALIWLFAKKYNWNNWSHKLFGKIDVPVLNNTYDSQNTSNF
jgi:hypothetical protein